MSTDEQNGRMESPGGLWDRLAELLSAPGGLETARLLQGALLRPAQAPGEQTEEEPEFLPAVAEQVQATIASAAGAARRITLIGESVAAGYFLAPFVTPAKVLAAQLNAGGGGGPRLAVPLRRSFGRLAGRLLGGAEPEPADWAVVDLTKAGMELPGLIYKSAVALRARPDVHVVFAGNNWLGFSPHPFEEPEGALGLFHEYADIVERSGPGGLRHAADQALRGRARQAVDRIAGYAAAAGVPVVFVVPPANLVDFESCQPVFWLPGDGVARWHHLHREAVERLRGEDWEAAAAAAHGMLEIDGGACATGHRLLAAALLAQGRDSAAYEALAGHLDAACWDKRFGRATATPGPVREELLASCRRHGLACVDAAGVLAEHTGSPLAGRRLFLDHCHLTAEGIRAVMAAVAAEVLRATGAGAPSWREIAALPVAAIAELPPSAAALSHLHAALYNAHLNRPAAGGEAPAVAAHLEAALAADPGSAAAMRDYMRAMAAPGRAFLTAACTDNQQSPFPLQALAWLPSDLGIDALEPIARVLARHGGGSPDEIAELDELLVAHHAVDGRGYDIAAPKYREQEPGAAETYPLRQQPPAIFRALWPASTFFLVTAGGSGVDLEITLRLPVPETVEVLVNGSPAGTVQATGAWSRHRLGLEAGRLRRGLNRVTLRWPVPSGDGSGALHTAVQRLRQGIPTDLYPVFGEVFSLWAGSSDCRRIPG